MNHTHPRKIVGLLVLFLIIVSVGITAPGFVARFSNPSPSNIPWTGELVGHGSNEIVVNVAGTDMTLQGAIDAGLFSGGDGSGSGDGNGGTISIEIAQAFRKDGSQDTGNESVNRPIIILQGPSTAFIALNNVAPALGSNNTTNTHDGIACNASEGWFVTGCWNITSERDNDVFPYPNGCLTNDFDQYPPTVELSISCARAVEGTGSGSGDGFGEFTITEYQEACPNGTVCPPTRVTELGAHDLCVLSAIDGPGGFSTRCSVSRNETTNLWELEIFDASAPETHRCTASCFDKTGSGGSGGNVQFETTVNSFNTAPLVSETFTCPGDKKIVSCYTIEVPNGERMCGTSISADGTRCTYGGCTASSAPNQSYQTQIVCAGIN
jgi:hypothetical protein